MQARKAVLTAVLSMRGDPTVMSLMREVLSVTVMGERAKNSDASGLGASFCLILCSSQLNPNILHVMFVP